MRGRDEVRAAVVRACEALPAVRAVWEAGSAAFGRVDDWSDLDLSVLVEDDAVEQVFSAVDAALERLGGVALRHRLPEPTWHGHALCFYQLVQASPTLLVDLAVMRRSSPGRFLERERHGVAVVLFDRGEGIGPVPTDAEAEARRRAAALHDLAARVALFAPRIEVAVARGDLPEAVSLYHSVLLRALVTALRARHDPLRWDFGLRYLRHDLPAPVYQRVLRLLQPGDRLLACTVEARAWFEQLRDAGSQAG